MVRHPGAGGGDEEDAALELAARRKRLQQAEDAWVAADALRGGKGDSAQGDADAGGGGWVKQYTDTVLGNLQLSITNVHVRYEHAGSGGEDERFAAGVLLRGLHAQTVDEHGQPAFVSRNAMGTMRKRVTMEGLALYHDIGAEPLTPPGGKAWAQLSADEWRSTFGVAEAATARAHTFVLCPIDLGASYVQLGGAEAAKRALGAPVQAMSLEVQETVLRLGAAQYQGLMYAAEGLSRATAAGASAFAHLRPVRRPKHCPRRWWRYAFNALRRTALGRKLGIEWRQVQRLSISRRKYIEAHTAVLLGEDKDGEAERTTEQLDGELEYEVALLFRCLAQAEAKRRRREKEEAAQQSTASSWYGWLTGRGKTAAASREAASAEGSEGAMGADDWATLQSLIDDNKWTPPSDQAPNAVQMQVHVRVASLGLDLVHDPEGGSASTLLDSRMINVDVDARMLSASTAVDVGVGAYFVGDILRSGAAAQGGQAVSVSLEMPPLPAADGAAPAADIMCHAEFAAPLLQVRRVQLDEVVDFFSRTSQDVDLSATATVAATVASQASVEAQARLQNALASRTRLALDLSIGAPQVLIPSLELESGSVDERCALLVDLGRLTVGAAPSNDPDYEHFDVSLLGASARLISHDAAMAISQQAELDRDSIEAAIASSSAPILDPFGIHVGLDLQQSTSDEVATIRVAAQLESVRVHASGARIRQLTRIGAALSQQAEHTAEVAAQVQPTMPWRELNTFELFGAISVLEYDQWGARLEWSRAWAAISGPYLVILDAQDAQRPQRWVFLGGGKLAMPLAPETAPRQGEGVATLVVHPEGTSTQQAAERAQDLSTCVLEVDEDQADRWVSTLRMAATKYWGLGVTSATAAASTSEHKQQLQFVGTSDAIEVVLSGNVGSGESVPLAIERPIASVSLVGGRIAVDQHSTCMDVRAAFASLHGLDLLSDDHFPLLASSIEGAKALPTVTVWALEELVGGDQLMTTGLAETRYFDVPPLTSRTASIYLESSCGSSIAFAAVRDQVYPTGLFERDTDLLSVYVSMDSPNSWRRDAQTADTAVAVTLQPLHLFCRTVTVRALMVFPEQLSTAAAAPAATHGDEAMTLFAAPAEDASADAGVGSPEEKDVQPTGSGRTRSRLTFSVAAKVRSLTLSLVEESGEMVAALAISEVDAGYASYSDSRAVVTGTLGCIRLVDGYYSPKELHWEVVGLTNPTKGALVKVRYESLAAGAAAEAGHASSVDLEAASLRIVYLARFVDTATRFASGLVGGAGAPADSSGVPASATKVQAKTSLSAPPSDVLPLKMSVNIDAPVVYVPVSSQSASCLRLDMGKLRVRNELTDGCDVMTVGLDSASIAMHHTQRGELEITDTPLEAQVTITRPLKPAANVPAMSVHISVGNLVLNLTWQVAMLLMQLMEENIGEVEVAVPASSQVARDASQVVAATSSAEQSGALADASSPALAMFVTAALDTIHVRLSQREEAGVVEPLADLRAHRLEVRYISRADVIGAEAEVSLHSLALSDARDGVVGLEMSVIGRERRDESDIIDRFVALSYVASAEGSSAEVSVRGPSVRVSVDWAAALLGFVNGVTDTNRKKIGVGDLILRAERHIANDDVELSESCRLIADAPGTRKKFVFDGDGSALALPAALTHMGALVVVGEGCELHLTNVRIMNSNNLSASTYLKSGASVTFDNSVTFDGLGGAAFEDDGGSSAAVAGQSPPAFFAASVDVVDARVSVVLGAEGDGLDCISLQLPSLHLHSESGASDDPTAEVGPGTRMQASVGGMCAEHVIFKRDGAGLAAVALEARKLLDPADARLSYPGVDGQNTLTISPLRLRADPDTLGAASSLASSLGSFMVGPQPLLMQCTEYVRVISVEASAETALGTEVSFWSPIAPKGYAPLGHVAVSGQEPPTAPALALNRNIATTASHNSSALVRPERFEVAWVDPDECFSIWCPVAPPGYVTMGFVCAEGTQSPDKDCVRCAHASLVCRAALSECVGMAGVRAHDQVRLWRISGPLHTFALQGGSVEMSEMCTIRDPGILYNRRNPRLEANAAVSEVKSSRYARYAHCLSFECVHAQKADKGKDALAIWRVEPPAGYVALGDVISHGIDYPSSPTIVIRDHPALVARPREWRYVWSIDRAKDAPAGLAMWLPIPPTDDFVAVGCIVCAQGQTPSPAAVETFRCVHRSLLAEADPATSRRPVKALNPARGKSIRLATTMSGVLHAQQQWYFTMLFADGDDRAPLWELKDFEAQPLGGGHQVMTVSCPVVELTAYDNRPGRKNQPLLLVRSQKATDHDAIMAKLISSEADPASADSGASQIFELLCALKVSSFNPELDTWEPLLEPCELLVRMMSESSGGSQLRPPKTECTVAAPDEVLLNVSSDMVYRLIDALKAFSNTGQANSTFTLRNALAQPVYVCSTFAGESLYDEFIDVASGGEITIPIPVGATQHSGRAALEAPKLVTVDVVAVRGLPSGAECRVVAGIAYRDVCKGTCVTCATRWVRLDDDGACALSERLVVYGEEISTAEPSLRLDVMYARSTSGVRGAPSQACAVLAVDTLPKVCTMDIVENMVLAANGDAGEIELTVRVARVSAVSLSSRSFRGKQALAGSDGGVLPRRVLYSLTPPDPTAESSDQLTGWEAVSMANKVQDVVLARPDASLNAPLVTRIVLAEQTFEAARRRIVLRSPVSFHNKTDIVLVLAASAPGGGTEGDSPASPTSLGGRVAGVGVIEMEAFENHRFIPFKRWGGKGNLFPTERKTWQYSVNGNRANSHQDPRARDVRVDEKRGQRQPWLDDELEWTSGWQLDTMGLTQGAVDKDGWAYALDFTAHSMGGLWKPEPGQGTNGKTCFVRRRRWIRRARLKSSGEDAAAGGGGDGPANQLDAGWMQAAKVDANETIPMPHLCMGESAPALALALAPGGTRSTTWTEVAHSGSGDALAPALLRKAQRWLLRCSGSAAGGDETRSFVCTEAIPTNIGGEDEGGAVDWTVTVTPPLTVVNALPFKVDVGLWSRAKRAQPALQKTVEQLASGATHREYLMDMTRPTFIGLSHSYADTMDKPNLFLVHDYEMARTREAKSAGATFAEQSLPLRLPSGRVIEVAVKRACNDDYDAGASVAVRLEVPFWLNKKVQMPLAFYVQQQLGVVGDDGDFTPADGAPLRPLETIIDGGATNVVSFRGAKEEPETMLLRVAMMTGGEMAWSDALPIFDGDSQTPALGSHVVRLAEESSRKTFSALVTIEGGDGEFASSTMVDVQPCHTVANRTGMDVWLFGDMIDAEGRIRLHAGEVKRELAWRSYNTARALRVSLDGEGLPNTRITLGGTEPKCSYGFLEEGVYLSCACYPGALDTYHLEITLVSLDQLPYRVENNAAVPITLQERGQPTVTVAAQAAAGWVFNGDGLGSAVHEAVRLWPAADESAAAEVSLDGDPQLLDCPALGNAGLTAWLRDDGPVRVLVVGPSRRAQCAYMPNDAVAAASVGLLPSVTTSGASQQGARGRGFFEARLVLHGLGVSLIDSTPEEIAFLGLVQLNAGIVTCGATTHLGLSAKVAQIDNCLVGTPFPVLFAQPSGSGNAVAITLVSQAMVPGVTEIPFVRAALSPDNLILVHERLVWRLMDWVAEMGLEQLSVDASAGSAPPAVDPALRLDNLRIERAHAKVTIKTTPQNRPGWLASNDAVVAGLNLVDGVELPVLIRRIQLQRFTGRQSKLVAALVKNLTQQVTRQAIRILTKNVGVLLGNVASSMQVVNNRLANLSMDKEYIRERNRARQAVDIDNVADGLLEGGDALAHGLFRGVTGVFLRPVEGAKKDGFAGFVRGVGKGVIGLATQPVTGVIDLAAQTTEGVIKTLEKGKDTAKGVVSKDWERNLARMREPRAIIGRRIAAYDPSEAEIVNREKRRQLKASNQRNKLSRNFL